MQVKPIRKHIKIQAFIQHNKSYTQVISRLWQTSQITQLAYYRCIVKSLQKRGDLYRICLTTCRLLLTDSAGILISAPESTDRDLRRNGSSATYLCYSSTFIPRTSSRALFFRAMGLLVRLHHLTLSWVALGGDLIGGGVGPQFLPSFNW